MKTNVVTDSKFIVKPEDGIVVCIMDAVINLDALQKIYYVVDTPWWKKKAPMVDTLGRVRVVAKAKCGPKDTFDEALGKKIAESRAKQKVFKIANNVWSSILDKLNIEVSIAQMMAENTKEMCKIEKKHTSELIESI